MPEAQKYTGGCHCGQVRYEVETDLGMVISCNCSICTKKGLLPSFVPAQKFSLLSGESELVDYQFNKHVVHHLSCPAAGWNRSRAARCRTARPWWRSMCAASMG